MYSWYTMTATKCVVNLPLIWRPIATSFAISVLKLQGNLRSPCTNTFVTTSNTATQKDLTKTTFAQLLFNFIDR
nr:hypothetical protein Iba_chr12cCG23910 [Ipomoea batatas]